MATQIQRRRGTTAEHSTFIGALGELTVDTDKKTVVVHDGSTAGGSPLAVAATVAATVASTYAPIASPTLTGTPTAPTATAGTNTTQIATTAFVQQQASALSLPAGSLIYCAGSAVPAGYLEANGALLSRTTYAALFAAIGVIYNAGDGSTTFGLPDLRGEFIRGWDKGRGLDAGRLIGSWQGDEIRSHQHGTPYRLVRGGTVSEGQAAMYVGGGSTAWTSNSGGDETRPRNVALLAMIKY